MVPKLMAINTSNLALRSLAEWEKDPKSIADWLLMRYNNRLDNNMVKTIVFSHHRDPHVTLYGTEVG